ncbi:MAG TPA: 16S rRNA (cytosine(1402)-N(4))-methyltransferase RsmH [Candidatus Kapabacteria bacterium]|nr:16S rRNA (cytosine(1402)-N(4))-methyltransferase RsmH [Candidatus Kapabacteria bacterium]HPP38979.1 16S rRNA (cytosine(1402)-N(4))-methyltransferase RsmH [Candidatus Kapabacteria bacterium]
MPVLGEKSVELLINRQDGIYIDGTLGGGGHAAIILRKLSSGGNLWAFDKDENSIRHCRIKFEEELNKKPPRLVLLNCGFEEAFDEPALEGNFSGLLLDLGVSSMQLDTDSRGLSYRVNSDLDMRFGGSGISAEDLLNSSTEEQIYHILRNYGEEPRSRAIARAIVTRRKLSRIRTTFELREIVESCTPKPLQIRTLSRVFQAFRIAVNRELEVLEYSLRKAIEMLSPGGRIVVISYHSLEDRIVKHIFKEHAIKKGTDNISNTVPKLKILTTKPIIPDEEEIAINPRSRSAKLRAAEKIN